MKLKAKIINQAYQYISEGIILFLFMLFATQFSAVMENPYWSYISILFSSMVFFSLSAYFRLNLIFNFIGFLFLAFTLYSSGFSLSLTLIFSITLTYRYWWINKEEQRKAEALHLGIAAVLAFLLFILRGENEIIWMLVIQYGVIFFGYWLTHFFQVAPEERAGFGKGLWQIAVMMSLFSAAAFLILNNAVQQLFRLIWNGIGMITVLLSTMFANLFKDIQPQSELPELEGEVVADPLPEEAELGTSVMDNVEAFVSSYIILAVLIIAALIVFLFLLFRRKKQDIEESHHPEAVSKQITDLFEPSQQSRWSRRFKKPADPVRKLVYQFERKLAKTDYARKPHETIEKWLERISSGSELQTYQQVRYGNQDASASEISALKSELLELEKIIHKEKDNLPK